MRYECDSADCAYTMDQEEYDAMGCVCPECGNKAFFEHVDESPPTKKEEICVECVEKQPNTDAETKRLTERLKKAETALKKICDMDVREGTFPMKRIARQALTTNKGDNNGRTENY